MPFSKLSASEYKNKENNHISILGNVDECSLGLQPEVSEKKKNCNYSFMPGPTESIKKAHNDLIGIKPHFYTK